MRLFLLLSICWSTSFLQTLQVQNEWFHLGTHVLLDCSSIIHHIENRTRIPCAHRCLTLKGCHSFSFNGLSQLCQFYNTKFQCITKATQNGGTQRYFINTGSSSGIGAYTATYLAQYNPRLVLVARRKENLEDVAKKCQERGLSQNKILVLQADLSKQDDLQKIITDTINKFGQIDVLINNAAATEKVTEELQTVYTPQDFDAVMAVNLKAPIFLSQVAVPHLKKTKGSIINVSSVASTHAMPSVMLYCISKAGLNHFTSCLAIELAPFDVRVNCVKPGVIMTEAVAKSPPEMLEMIKSQVKTGQPLKGAGECEDVAKVMKFLASDDSSFITGESIYVDGGAHMMGPLKL